MARQRQPPPPPPPPKRQVPALALVRGLILVLIVPALVFAGVYAWGKHENFSASAKAPGAQGALVWSDGKVIFANRQEVAAWLREHGGSFEGFLKNHPAAVQLVSTPNATPTQTKLAAGRKTKLATGRTTKPTTHIEAVANVPNEGGSSNRTSAYALGGVALLFLLLACAPVAVLWRVPLLRVPELRLLFGGAGAAIGAGLLVTLLFS